MQRFMSTIVAIGLAAAPVAAQTTAPPTTSPPTAPSSTTAPSANMSNTSQRWYTRQNDDMRSSKLIGTTVRNSAGENIGDINEILIDKSGRVAAVVIGVGGFLGIGEREVAMNFNAIMPRIDSSGALVVTTTVTRDELRGAPALDPSSMSR